MRILVLTGIQEELDVIRKSFSLEFDKENRVYRDESSRLFLCTTGPGIRKKGKLLRRIEQIRPDLILLTGLCGSLSQSPEFKIGRGFFISQVTGLEKIPSSKPEGKKIVSVEHPIYDRGEKEDLQIETGADLVDMESAPLLDLVFNSIHFSGKLVLFRVIGDLPSQDRTFRLEPAYRRSRSRGFPGRLFFLGFGPGNFFSRFRLVFVREKALVSLRHTTSRLILELMQSGRNQRIPFFITGSIRKSDDN